MDIFIVNVRSITVAVSTSCPNGAWWKCKQREHRQGKQVIRLSCRRGPEQQPCLWLFWHPLPWQRSRPLATEGIWNQIQSDQVITGRWVGDEVMERGGRQTRGGSWQGEGKTGKKWEETIRKWGRGDAGLVQETEKDEGRVRGVDDKLMSTSMSIRAHTHRQAESNVNLSLC